MVSDIPAGDGIVANLFYVVGGIRRETNLRNMHEQKKTTAMKTAWYKKSIEENKSDDVSPAKGLNFAQIIKDMWKTG